MLLTPPRKPLATGSDTKKRRGRCDRQPRRAVRTPERVAASVSRRAIGRDVRTPRRVHSNPTDPRHEFPTGHRRYRHGPRPKSQIGTLRFDRQQPGRKRSAPPNLSHRHIAQAKRRRGRRGWSALPAGIARNGPRTHPGSSAAERRPFRHRSGLPALPPSIRFAIVARMAPGAGRNGVAADIGSRRRPPTDAFACCRKHEIISPKRQS